MRSLDKLVPEDYVLWVAKVEGTDAYRDIGLCCDDSVARCHCDLQQTIAKVVCAVESQQSTFDFTSVEFDLW